MIRRSSKCVANLSTWIKILLDSLTGRKKLVFRRQFLDCEKCNIDISLGKRGSSMDHQGTYYPSMARLPLPKCNNCITKYTGQVPHFLKERIYEDMKSEYSIKVVTFAAYLVLSHEPCIEESDGD